MKETGILMKPFLIEAIMNTQLNTWPPQPIDPDKPFKGMTRRIIKTSSKVAAGFVMTEDYRGRKWPIEIDEDERMFDNDLKFPYGQPGDLLYVKEPHYLYGWHDYHYNENDRKVWTFHPENRGIYYSEDFGNRLTTQKVATAKGHLGWHKKSPLFMSKKYARIWLQIVDIKPERLQDISEQDAIWEGIENSRPLPFGYMNYLRPDLYFKKDKKYDGIPAACYSFATLIESINGPDTWNSNPWVWVISFKVLSITGRSNPTNP